jgi:hypothetical protein
MVEVMLATELPRARDRRLVLLHARYPASAPQRFVVEVDGASRPVEVRDEQSVLGIVDAWQAHQRHGGDAVLVVTTGVSDDMLGWDILGHAVGRATLTVDRAEIVKHRFGARELDPRVRRSWLLEALLEAEPPGGWPRSGPVLTRDTAVRALLRARLGIDDEALDAGTLLEWSQTSLGPARFADLPAAEQEGLRDWLQETVGGVAVVLAALLVQGRAADAMALGVIARVLEQPKLSADVAVAVGGLLGGVPVRPEQRRDFVTAVEGTLERWASAAENGGVAGEAAGRRLVEVVERAPLPCRRGWWSSWQTTRSCRRRSGTGCGPWQRRSSPSRTIRRWPWQTVRFGCCVNTGSLACTPSDGRRPRWQSGCCAGSARPRRRFPLFPRA